MVIEHLSLPIPVSPPKLVNPACESVKWPGLMRFLNPAQIKNPKSWNSVARSMTYDLNRYAFENLGPEVALRNLARNQETYSCAGKQRKWALRLSGYIMEAEL